MDSVNLIHGLASLARSYVSAGSSLAVSGEGHCLRLWAGTTAISIFLDVNSVVLLQLHGCVVPLFRSCVVTLFRGYIVSLFNLYGVHHFGKYVTMRCN